MLVLEVNVTMTITTAHDMLMREQRETHKLTGHEKEHESGNLHFERVKVRFHLCTRRTIWLTIVQVLILFSCRWLIWLHSQGGTFWCLPRVGMQGPLRGA